MDCGKGSCCWGLSIHWRKNEKLEIINHQFKVKCESQRDSLAAHKESLLCCSWKAKKAEGFYFFPQNWIIKLAKLQRRLNSTTGNSTMLRSGPGLVNLEMGISSSLHSKILKSQVLLTLFDPSEVLHSSLLKRSIPPTPYLKTIERFLPLKTIHVLLKIHPYPLWASSNWRRGQESMRNHHAIPRQHYMVIIQPVLPCRNLCPFSQATVHWRKRIPRNFKVIVIIQECKVI